MITVGYSTRTHNPEFIEYLKKKFKVFKKIEVIEKIIMVKKSLSEVYNEILSESNTDIVVLCHDDIYFDSKNWASKVLNYFKRNPDYGILGVAGSTSLPSSGKWWEDFFKIKRYCKITNMKVKNGSLNIHQVKEIS